MVPNILKLHCVKAFSMNKISVSETSAGDFNVVIYATPETDNDSEINCINDDDMIFVLMMKSELTSLLVHGY